MLDMAMGGEGAQLQELREAIEGVDLAVHGDVIVEARVLLDRLEARIAHAEAEYSKQGQAEIDGYPNMAAFLRHRARVTLPESRRLAKRASRIAAWPEVGDAWRSGRVTGAQVDVACASIPDRHVERFAQTLDETIAIVAPLNAHATGVVLRRWSACADDLAQREAAEAGIDPTDGAPDRDLSASRTLDDELSVKGHFDADSAAYIEKALTAATRSDGEGERRSPTQRRADALVEICRTFLEGLDNPDANRRKERLTLTADVIVLYRAWLKGLGIRTAADLEDFFDSRPNLGELDRGLFLDAFDGTGGVATTLDGNPVTDALVAAVAAGGAMELLLTANGRILDLGRSSRTYSAAQRRALLAFWGGCACCGAEPERCDIHHVQPWENGGLTDIANAVPKCRRCHHDHHRKHWRDHLEPDGTYVLRLPDGTERHHRPAARDAQLPELPVATTARPFLAPRYDPQAERRWTPWDEPDVIDLTRELIRARITNGDGHPHTEKLRNQLHHRLDQLERAA
jgi:hypothetical protein